MIQRLLALMIFANIVAIVLGFFGFVHPALDTIANFRTHFSVALLLLSFVWIGFAGRKSGILFTSFAMFGIYFGMGANLVTLASRSPVEPPAQGAYTLLHLNLYYVNPTPQKVFDLIKRTNPDIMTLNELSREWEQRLKVLDKDYPYFFHCPEWTVIGGSIIYSKFPMTGDKGQCHNYAALALKDVLIDGKVITIGSVHLRWPWPASGPRQVDELKPVLESLGPDALIAGDFNSTSWTWLVRRFAKYGNLKIIKYSGASWMYRTLPTALAKWFGLSLDNGMAKGRIRVFGAKIHEPVGSDHLPLLIRFSVR